VAAACLPEVCGTARAMRLLLGESIDAAAAFDAGLVSEVLPANQLAASAERRASDLAGSSAVALHAVTAAVRRQRAGMFLERLDAAIAIYRISVGPSHDAEEGIRAFLEKRSPTWSHH
jgi:enoyl-CoA hydratase/carnithine racemase